MRRSLLLGTLLVGGIACLDPASPREAPPLAGRFTLVTVEGTPLPYTIHPTSMFSSVEQRVLADTIEFIADGTGAVWNTSVFRDTLTDIETTSTLRTTFRHAWQGNEVVLSEMDCGENCHVFGPLPRYRQRGDALERLFPPGIWRYEPAL